MPKRTIFLESDWLLRGGIAVYHHFRPINRILLNIIEVLILSSITDRLKRLCNASYSLLCVYSSSKYFLDVALVEIHFCESFSLCLNEVLTQLFVLVASDLEIPL